MGMAHRIRSHGCSLSVAAPTTFLRRDEFDRPDKHRPSGSDPSSGKGDFFDSDGVADRQPVRISVLSSSQMT